MFNFRTDLALERRDLVKKKNNLDEIDGIETENKEIDKNLKVAKVKITNQNGEKVIRKTDRRLYYDRYKEIENSRRRRNTKSSYNFSRRVKRNYK